MTDIHKTSTITIFSGNLLERVCDVTEFEVEGWRQIPPLLDLLQKTEDYLSISFIDRLKLEMICLPKNEDFVKLNGKTIRDSWIYNHFTDSVSKNTKIVLYVNAVVPINQNLDRNQINQVENHCVVVKGIVNYRTVECIEIEDWNSSSEDTSFIPVDHPFFEEVQAKIYNIFKHHPGSDQYPSQLNKYGKRLAEIKYGKLENDWYDLKIESQADTEDTEDIPYKYEMVFIRRQSRCFQLKFIY